MALFSYFFVELYVVKFTTVQYLMKL